MDAPPKFELSIDEAAVLYCTATSVISRLTEADYPDRAYSTKLPSGFLCSGEAMMLLPALVCLLLNEHPSLLEPDVFEAAVKDAMIRHSTSSGKPN